MLVPAAAITTTLTAVPASFATYAASIAFIASADAAKIYLGRNCHISETGAVLVSGPGFPYWPLECMTLMEE